MSTRHTSTPKGRFVMRADSIRPCNCGGTAAFLFIFTIMGHTLLNHRTMFAIIAQTIPANGKERGVWIKS